MKFVASLIISVALIAAAVVLYYFASRADTTQDHYREAVSVARQIQQLDSSWSVETARVESDPLADFDSLAAFIPEMNRLENELTDHIRQIPDLSVQLSNDISSYLSVVDAKEERVERFKTSYAVVRNSVRYLPLAATNLIRMADEANDQRLAQDISRLTQDINAYLITPTEPEQDRLTRDLTALRNDSVTHPPQIANALANFVAHGDVLVARKLATDQIFDEATDADISQRTERIVSDLDMEARRAAEQGQLYELGVLGLLATLVLLWGVMAVFRFIETPVVRRSGAGDAPAQATPAPASADDGVAVGPADELAGQSPMPAAVGTAVPQQELPSAPVAQEARSGPAELRESPPVPSMEEILRAPAAPSRAAASEVAAPAAGPQTAFADAAVAGMDGSAEPRPGPQAGPIPEAKALHRIVTGFVANSLTGYVHQVATRLDHLQQSQDRMRAALESSDENPFAPGSHLDEEMESSFAILASIRRQIDDVGALGARLATFSRQRDDEISYELINIESCVNEACDAVQADAYATVTKQFAPVPDIFASKFDMLLLLEYILGNAVLSVRELDARKGMIKIDVTRRNDEILITVVDNGDGFEADQKNKIFEPFYTTRENALGIGLPSAVYLASKYRGTVSANSLPGEGTVFRIALPAGITGETAI